MMKLAFARVERAFEMKVEGATPFPGRFKRLLRIYRVS